MSGGDDRLDIDIPAATVAFSDFGSAALASDFEPPAPCGDDVFTAAFMSAVAARQVAEKSNKALVSAAELAAAELGAENIANYEAQDAQNNADLSDPAVFV